MLVEVILGPLHVRLDGIGILRGVPISGTHLTVLLNKLERLDKSQGFVHRPSHGQIVDRDLPEHTLGIDDEQTTEGDTGILKEDIVVPSDLLGEVRQQGVLQLTQSSVLALQIRPCQVAKVRVDGDTNHFCVNILELLDSVAERDDLSGTDEGAGIKWKALVIYLVRGSHDLQVQRVEEQH